MIYLQLFFSYLKIGFFGFGGGYAMLSLIQNEVVVRHQWISNGEFIDIVAISQITPGPIAINSASYVGYVVTGSIWGSVIATVAVCLPALTLMLLATRFYFAFRDKRTLQNAMMGNYPMIIGMIAGAALLLLTPENFTDFNSWIILLLALIAAIKRVNPIWIILSAGLAGYLLYGGIE